MYILIIHGNIFVLTELFKLSKAEECVIKVTIVYEPKFQNYQAIGLVVLLLSVATVIFPNIYKIESDPNNLQFF